MQYTELLSVFLLSQPSWPHSLCKHCHTVELQRQATILQASWYTAVTSLLGKFEVWSNGKLTSTPPCTVIFSHNTWSQHKCVFMSKCFLKGAYCSTQFDQTAPEFLDMSSCCSNFWSWLSQAKMYCTSNVLHCNRIDSKATQILQQWYKSSVTHSLLNVDT